MPTTTSATSSSADEAAIAFLKENRRTALFVKGLDGQPRGWPLFRFYRPGTLFFTTYKKSPKVRHLEAASRALAVVQTEYGVTPVAYASVEGALRVMDITPDNVDMIFQYSMPNTDAGVDESVKERFRNRLLAGKRVLIELDIETIRLFAPSAGEPS